MVDAGHQAHQVRHDDADKADRARERDGGARGERRAEKRQPLRPRDVDAARGRDVGADAQQVQRRGQHREYGEGGQNQRQHAGDWRKPADVEKAFQDQLIKEGLTQDQFNKRVEEQIMKVKLIEQEVKSKVELPKEPEVRDFFDKIKAKMAGKPVKTSGKEEEADLSQISKYLERMTGEQVNIRHILIRSQRSEPASERAKARSKLEGVLQKIRGGEDFAFMAKKHTDDPLSKERGGDLGFIAKGDLGLPEMDAAIFKLKEGEVSPVIETEIGYHIVKMVEKKNPHQLEYDDVRDDLANYLAQRVFTQKLEKYLKDLRAKASIKVNPID